MNISPIDVQPSPFLPAAAQALRPSVTTSINLLPDQVYCLEIPLPDPEMKAVAFFINLPFHGALPK